MQNDSKEELQKFVYIVSHDLNAPLRHIKEFTRLLLNQLDGTLHDKSKLYADIIKNSINKAESMMDGLLQFSRLNTIKNPVIDFDSNKLIEKIKQSLNDKIQEKHAKIQVVNKLPKIHGDEERIEKVLACLIDNSIKFHKKETAPEIYIQSTEDNDKWEFSVKDNGIGIAPQHHAKIFDIFTKLHPEEEYKGMGMGLPICKRIVENHGGKIGIISKENEGALFTFTIAKHS